MAVCRFADGAGIYDVTPIENMFLLEYLPTAPDGFLRVYLYMRMLALHPEMGESVEDAAQALRMDLDSVLNAMTYWERQGLVCRLSDRPPTYALMSVHGAGLANPMENDYYEYRDFNAELQDLFGAENLLSPKQYSMAYDWMSILQFTQEAVLRMVSAQLKKGRARKPETVFAKVDEMAARWSERGVKTLADVELALAYEGEVETTVKAVQKRLSIRREPTMEELEMVGRWLNEWEYTTEQIVEKCAETVKARNPSFDYLNGILKNGREKRSRYFQQMQNVLRVLTPYNTYPTDPQIESYEKMLEAGFEPETIQLAAERCRDQNQTRFDDLRMMLGDWQAEKLFRRDAVEARLQQYDLLAADVRALMKIAGIGRNPRLSDVTMYEKWTAEYPDELIRCAAECALGMDKPMLYINNRLARWAEDGVKTADEARAKQADRSRQGSAPAANPALNYEQREHTDSDYDDLFVDLTREYGEGGAKA